MTNLEKLKISTNTKLTEALDDIIAMETLIRHNSFFINEFKKRDIENKKLIIQNQIFKYRLFIGILLCDICSSLNIYFKAETRYEEKYAIRNLIVVINEGFKKIFNFQKINEKGNVKSTYRNNSFWVKEIKPIINSDFIEYEDEYQRITEKLEKYLEFDFNKIKEERDLSIHYDRNPILIINMIIELDIENKVPFLLSFMDILDEMYFFTEKLGNHYRKDIEESYDKFQYKLSIKE